MTNHYTRVASWHEDDDLSDLMDEISSGGCITSEELVPNNPTQGQTTMKSRAFEYNLRPLAVKLATAVASTTHPVVFDIIKMMESVIKSDEDFDEEYDEVDTSHPAVSDFVEALSDALTFPQVTEIAFCYVAEVGYCTPYFKDDSALVYVVSKYPETPVVLEF